MTAGNSVFIPLFVQLIRHDLPFFEREAGQRPKRSAAHGQLDDMRERLARVVCWSEDRNDAPRSERRKIARERLKEIVEKTRRR